MTDPKSVVEQAIDGISFTKDNGSTAGTYQVLYPGGPEDYYDLFITANYDAILVIGEPRLQENRYIQNVPTYDTWAVPVSVKAIDKYSTGTRVCTAPKILEKVRRSLQTQVEGAAVGTGYTMKVINAGSSVRFYGGVFIHETNFSVEVKESQ